MVRDGDAADRDNDFRHASKHPDAGNGPQDFEDEQTEIKDILPCYSYQPNGMADMNLNPTLVKNIRTFDYFKEVVAGKKGTIRSDMSVSEDDNVLVRGVAGDEGAIGFFGAAYYFENQEALKAVSIRNNAGNDVLPSATTIEDGSYNPFSRPLFIYVKARSARKPYVRAFVEFYLKNAASAAREVGYVGLPDAIYQRASKAFEAVRTGSSYLDENGKKKTGPITDLYK